MEEAHIAQAQLLGSPCFHKPVISPRLLGCEILRHLTDVWLWKFSRFCCVNTVMMVSGVKLKNGKIIKKQGACSFQWKVFQLEILTLYFILDFSNQTAFLNESCDTYIVWKQ